MNIFLSWSGESSKELAAALGRWLADVFPEVSTWMSDQAIQAGARWGTQLDQQLQDTHFGVICLSPENVNSPWLLFEAGALSKSIETSRVVPYCLGFSPLAISGPLSRFQGVSADRIGTLKLLKSINAVLDNKRSDDNLDRVFSKWWPDLEKHLLMPVGIEGRGPAHVTVRNVFFASMPRFEHLGAEDDLSILKQHYACVTSLRNVTREELSNALADHRYEIVHLLGDVDSDGHFVFADGAKLTPSAMLKLLTLCEAQLVVLATCDSSPLGAALSRQMSVIAALQKVGIERIIPWERSFYRLLAAGNTLATSFDISQTTVDLAVVLMMRNDAVFLPSHQATTNG